MIRNDNTIRNTRQTQTHTHANTTMVFTRSQAKKQQEQPQEQPQEKPQQRQQMHRKCKNTLPENRRAFINSPIDFVDASIEWRKNKIKGENCTFEYIFL